MIMPLVLLPMIIVTIIIGFVSINQIYQEVSKANKADLEHISIFTIDTLGSYFKQLQFHEQEMEQERKRKLKDLAEMATRVVENQFHQAREGTISDELAKSRAYQSLKRAGVGEFGYIYVMTSSGDLVVHVDREGENIIGVEDESGRKFIQEICNRAVTSEPDITLYVTYPWANEIDREHVREKEVAYRYFREWDWIIAAGSYLKPDTMDHPFSVGSFEDLRRSVTGKLVNRPGQIYVMDCSANLILHSENEGDNIYQHFDLSGRAMISKLCRGEIDAEWLYFQPQGETQSLGGRRFARLSYFEPWNWIVVVEMEEEDLVRPAKTIAGRILLAMVFMLLAVGALGVMLGFLVAKLFTDPIRKMTSAMLSVKSGHLEERLPVETKDELGQMAAAFNQMSEMLKRDLDLEERLTRQQKMASLGVFSAEVAHEINNPMGIILGYAYHLETKMDPDDPRYHFVQEIRRESKRCVGILSDLLNYAKPPDPVFEATDFADLIDQILDFAVGHKEMKNIALKKIVEDALPEIMVDRDMIRQVVMNLILNGAAAMPEGGEIVLRLSVPNSELVMEVEDQGTGIKPEDREKVFEPFFSTRRQGTGLGLAITKQIIDAHMGTIQISSVPGKGTTVRVYLPIRQDDM